MTTYPKPIGIILQEAKLITPGQLEVALYEQKQFQMLLGEILSHHGWICQETADFFVDRWPVLIKRPLHHPIGYYLKSAHLLNEEQIEGILRDQQQLGVRFGDLAVLRGWLKEETIDFFVKSITDRLKEISPPLIDEAFPVPQLKIFCPRLSPFMEAQAKDTYPQKPISEPKARPDNGNKNHQPKKIVQDTPRQAAETLILFDKPGGDRHFPQEEKTIIDTIAPS